MNQRGQRKMRQAVTAQLVLLAGLAVAAIASVPEPVFWAFVLGVTGNLGAFTWGNVRVHQIGGENGEAPKPTAMQLPTPTRV